MVFSDLSVSTDPFFTYSVLIDACSVASATSSASTMNHAMWRRLKIYKPMNIKMLYQIDNMISYHDEAETVLVNQTMWDSFQSHYLRMILIFIDS